MSLFGTSQLRTTQLRTTQLRLTLFVLLLCHQPLAMSGEEPGEQLVQALAKELATVDRTFFQRGFNDCDLAFLERQVSPDLVFYHDQSGVQDKALFMENTRKYLCAGGPNKPIRKLVPGSLSTFPLFKQGVLYGAIQSGEHQFYLRSSSAADVLTGRARFTNVWTKQNNGWQLANVLSYDHTSISEQESRLLDILQRAQVPAMAIGTLQAGHVINTRVYGDLQKDVPAPQNAIFKVASLTKPVVAMLTLGLIAEGKLGLDEKLSDYWVDPDIRDDKRHELLTPRLILSHQTGFENWRWMAADKKLRFVFTPGSKHQYSGEGFEYLRKALEAKFSSSLEQLAARLVFEPAGMRDTYFWWEPAVDESRYAVNHDAAGKPLPVEKYHEANAAANLLTTIDDYTRFLAFVMRQKARMPELYQAMVSPQVTLGENAYFGLGWQILAGFPDNEQALLHSGKDPGVNTLAVFFPKSGNGYVIFFNGDNKMPVLEEVLPDLYLGRELWNKR